MITVDVSVPPFEPELVRAFRDEFARRLPGVAADAQRWARAEVTAHLQLDPTYDSLRSGVLRAEFGLADPGAADAVVYAVATGVAALVTPPGPTGLGGVRLEFGSTATLAALANGPLGRYVSNPSGRGVSWLFWLLFAGPSIVLASYEVFRGSRPIAKSRTGYTVMRSPSSRPARGWGVPGEFAGAPGGNWVETALRAAADGAEAELTRLLARL